MHVPMRMLLGAKRRNRLWRPGADTIMVSVCSGAEASITGMAVQRETATLTLGQDAAPTGREEAHCRLLGKAPLAGG
jgi:hypothetical protein